MTEPTKKKTRPTPPPTRGATETPAPRSLRSIVLATIDGVHKMPPRAATEAEWHAWLCKHDAADAACDRVTCKADPVRVVIAEYERTASAHGLDAFAKNAVKA